MRWRWRLKSLPPWNLDHRLVRIGISAEEIDASERPAVNLVLLVDTSGSMNSGDKLQLVQATLRMLADQLREDDRVSIVTYAGSASVPLSEAKGNETTKILAAIDAMRAGGSTAGRGGDSNRVRPRPSECPRWGGLAGAALHRW